MRNVTLEPMNVENQISLEIDSKTSMKKPDLVLSNEILYGDTKPDIVTGGIKPMPLTITPLIDAGSSIINPDVSAELIGGVRDAKTPVVTENGLVIITDTSNDNLVKGGGGGIGGGLIAEDEVVEATANPKKFPYVLAGVALVVGYLIFRKK